MHGVSDMANGFGKESVIGKFARRYYLSEEVKSEHVHENVTFIVCGNIQSEFESVLEGVSAASSSAGLRGNSASQNNDC